MPIQLLPLQLANQIAAGEVVERPAAVVKELVENGLDAGANHIDIEIEGGGSQLIRVRDNGRGIAKEELTLALARHATSKISSLADLQAVMTLGFRGEALASINAVSRLSIASRTAQQAQAWEIYAEGREEPALFRPLAHPVGTTVEVLELFYNTPARRKFLRSVKTEFSHIDEVVRRIALGCFELGVTLTHNGKRIRCYRPAVEQASREQRLGAVCGQTFAQQAMTVSGEQQQLKLQGWVTVPSGARAHSDLQYCYVNGRMIRDKLITHAVRQAYHHQLTAQQHPAFVLFLTIDPQQVDVNVHPAKQEVRFYQGRIVHDFIYQTVLAAVSEWDQNNHLGDQLAEVLPSMEGSFAVIQAPADTPGSRSVGVAADASVLSQQPQKCRSFLSTAESRNALSPRWSVEKLAPYRALLQSDSNPKVEAEEVTVTMDHDDDVDAHSKSIALCGQTVAARSLGRVLTMWQHHYVVLERPAGLALLSLPMAKRCWQHAQLLPESKQPSRQPLLFPLTLELSSSQTATAKRYQQLLAQLALLFTLEHHQLTLQAVPPLLGKQDLPALLLALLDYLHPSAQADVMVVTEWLVQRLTPKQQSWQLSQAIQLLTELELCCPQLVEAPPASLLQLLDLTPVAAQLKTA